MNNYNNGVHTTNSTRIKVFSAGSAADVERKVNEWLSKQQFSVHLISQKIAASDCNRFRHSVLIVHDSSPCKGNANSLRVKIFSGVLSSDVEAFANGWLSEHSYTVHEIALSVAASDCNRFRHGVLIVYENELD